MKKEYIKINENTIEEVTRRRIDLQELKNRLTEIEKEIKFLKSQPDEIKVSNEDKFTNLRNLEEERKHILEILKQVRTLQTV